MNPPETQPWMKNTRAQIVFNLGITSPEMSQRIEDIISAQAPVESITSEMIVALQMADEATCQIVGPDEWPRKEIRAALKHAQIEVGRLAAHAPQQWIPVSSERLPKLNETVLVVKGGLVESAERGEDGDEWYWCEPCGVISDSYYDDAGESTVTHWMPLPAPPVPETPCAPLSEFCSRCGEQHDSSNCPTPAPPGPPNPPRFFSCCGARLIIGVAEQHKSTCQRHHGGNVGVSLGMETGISRLVAAGTAPDAEGSESQFKSDALTSPAAPSVPPGEEKKS